jgi:hypothetical protein
MEKITDGAIRRAGLQGSTVREQLMLNQKNNDEK